MISPMRWPWQKRDTWWLTTLSVKGLYAGVARIRKFPSAKKADYPVFIEFSLPYEGNKVSPDRFDFFEEIEKQMEILEQANDFLLVACLTHDNVREWLFYAKDRDVVVQCLFESFGDHKPQISAIDDPKWDNYYDLFEVVRQ